MTSQGFFILFYERRKRGCYVVYSCYNVKGTGNTFSRSVILIWRVSRLLKSVDHLYLFEKNLHQNSCYVTVVGTEMCLLHLFFLTSSSSSLSFINDNGYYSGDYCNYTNASETYRKMYMVKSISVRPAIKMRFLSCHIWTTSKIGSEDCYGVKAWLQHYLISVLWYAITLNTCMYLCVRLSLHRNMRWALLTEAVNINSPSL